MKSIYELEGCLEGNDRILFETEHCCAFHRNNRLWFANDIGGEDGWYESMSLCEIAQCYQHEIKDAINSELSRAIQYVVSRDGQRLDQCRLSKPLYASVPMSKVESDEDILFEPGKIVIGLHTSEGVFRVIRVDENPDA